MTDPKTSAARPDPRVEQAKAYLANGQYAESVALLTELLSLPGQDAALQLAKVLGTSLREATGEKRQSLLSAVLDHPDGAQYVIDAIVDQDNIEVALLLASQLSDRNPADNRAALLYGWLLLRVGRFEAALEMAARAAATDPSNPEILSLNAETHLAQGDQLLVDGAGDEAMAAYQLALRGNDALLAALPETPQVYMDRARIHIRLNDTQAAVKDYGQALELAPDFFRAYIERARLQVTLDHWDAALSDVAKALEIAPEDLEALAVRADARAAQGDASASDGDAAGAEQAYRKALVDFDTLAERASDAFSVFLNRARTRRNTEDIAGSIADYGRAITLEPGLATAYNERGNLYEFTGDYELALADYQRFLNLAPDEPVGYLNQADALLALNRYDDARASYEKALALKADFPEAQLGHARALGLLHRWDEAVAAVDAALTGDAGRALAIGLRADIHAAHGDVANEQGDVSAAEQAYRKAVDDYGLVAVETPEAPGVFLSRAQTYSKLNEPDAALADFARAIELDPGSAIAYNGRGLIYEQQGRFDDALADYEHVVSLLPNDPVGWRNHADALLALDRFDDALESYTHALEHAPQFVEARLGHARAEAALGHWDAAISDVEQAIGIDPENLEALALRADIRAARGDQIVSTEPESDASEAWRAALADYNTLAERAPEVATVFLSRAQTRRKLDDIDGALADYGRAIERDPELATAYNERGLLYEFSGNYESALADYTQAVRLAPDDPAGYRNKADVLFALARFGEAGVDYGRALELLPDFVDARLGRSRAFAAQGFWDEALKDTADVLALDAENLEALGLQADIWATRGDQAVAAADKRTAETAYEKAVAICDRAIALAPEDPAILVTRATYRARTDQFKEALADCDQAIALDPEQVDAHILKGLLHEALEDEEAALGEYERAIRLAPNKPDGYLHRANLRLNREQYQMAVWDFNRALDRGSDDAAPYLGRAYALLGLYYGYNENGLYAKAHESAVKALHDCDRALELGAEQDTDLYYHRGLIQLALEDFEASSQTFDLALAEPGQEPETRASILLSRAEASLGWGQQLHLDPPLKAALSGLSEAIDLTSDASLLGPLHETRGRVWLELGDYTEAHAAFTQALDYTPHEPLPLIGRAKAAYFAEDFGKARKDFEALIEAHSDDRTVRLSQVGLGLILEQLAQPEEAARSFDNALSVPPTARAYLDRYDIFSEFRAFAHAEADLRQALALEPESPEVLNSLAWISTEYQADEARLREALEFAKRSIDLEGQGIARGNYLDTLGWVLHLLKQDRDALPYLQQAVALADYDQQIRHHSQVVEEALQSES